MKVGPWGLTQDLRPSFIDVHVGVEGQCSALIVSLDLTVLRLINVTLTQGCSDQFALFLFELTRVNPGYLFWHQLTLFFVVVVVVLGCFFFGGGMLGR